MPEDIRQILTLIAGYAKLNDNQMKWSEEAKLKSDMMRNRGGWCLIASKEIAEECRLLGMREEDVRTIQDMHARLKQGRRLVPDRSFRGFEFNHQADRFVEIYGEGDC